MEKTTTSLKEPQFSKDYQNYVLALLTLVYTFNFFDRQIVTILQEPIKADLGLFDWQLGLLSGLSFALFYTFLGIPIARYADKANRRNIVAISLTLWSGMTALTGYTQNFIQILLARMGVGIGEAGGSPPAHSMISDYFPPKRRATALSIYSMGVYFGLMIAFGMGGWLASTYGWRQAFLIVGIPGIILAILMRLTVKEPIRGFYDDAASKKVETPPFFESIKFLFSKKTFTYLAFATGLHAFVGYANTSWMPSLMLRIHGGLEWIPPFASEAVTINLTVVGLMFAFSVGVGGGLGTFLGGFLSDRLSKRDNRWYCWISALSILISIPFGYAVIFTGNMTLLVLMFFISNVLFGMYLGPSIAVSHSLVPPHFRAMASAVLFFVLNLIGIGMGPLVTGIFSDLLAPTFGDESVRYALAISVVADLAAMWLFYKAAGNLNTDLESIESPTLENKIDDIGNN
ncbi:MAG: MFS transporter [Bacteroidia bacterium]|nr:MFS transporter [Bacteroidia bacterium]